MSQKLYPKIKQKSSLGLISSPKIQQGQKIRALVLVAAQKIDLTIIQRPTPKLNTQAQVYSCITLNFWSI